MELGVFFSQPTTQLISLNWRRTEQRALRHCCSRNTRIFRRAGRPNGRAAATAARVLLHLRSVRGIGRVAAATKTLKIGTGICLLPQRDPIVTAKNIASIDKLSGGRLVFGIGGGWNLDEMENHGVEHKSRFRQMREHVLAMKQLWTEETGEFHGEFVNFDPAYAEPKPTQRPHPPVILGGETDHTLKRVVEYCDGWLPRGRGGFDPAESQQRMTAMAEGVDRDPSSLSITVFGAPADRAELDKYQEAGIDCALLQMPTVERDACMKRLEEITPLVG